MQHLERLDVDSPIDSESDFEPVCPPVRLVFLCTAYSTRVLKKLGTLACFGPKTNVVENDSYRKTSSTIVSHLKPLLQMHILWYRVFNVCIGLLFALYTDIDPKLFLPASRIICSVKFLLNR